jgi:conjugative relaxase-like TrwC/TraI family protein
MFRPKPIDNPAKAAEYFGKTDGGYYLDEHDNGDQLRRAWGGAAMEPLGLTGAPTLEQLNRVLAGLHPETGQQLTAQLKDDRVPGWTFTASVPKGVTTALENGDGRIRQLLWDAGNAAMEDVQAYGKTRVRKGGKEADRDSGMMLWLGVEHDDTRPLKEDGMPDWDRHLHFIVPNVTFDPVEQEWKALKVRKIFDKKKFFDRSLDSRMAAGVAELGYEIETKLQVDENGARYYTWDIKAAPGHEAGWKSINAKNSRRSGEIEETEEYVIAAIKARDADAPDALSAVAKDKLGATSRLTKRKDLTRAEVQAYWQARITPEERLAIDATIARARLGQNPSPEPCAAEAMDYAIRHHFERSSVVDFHDLAVTAMERSMGAASPEDFSRQVWGKHGALFSGDDVSTRQVLDQEQRIIGFARAGRGTCTPLLPERAAGLEELSQEQQTAVRHVWHSTDRVMLIRGGAGTGKTTMMTPALKFLGAPVGLLAPSSDASRGQLGEKPGNTVAAFKDANTVAAFLGSKDMQAKVKRGVIWVDEAGLLAIDDLEKLCGMAKELDARLVLQGDPAQHKAVSRHGNMLQVLEEFAGLKPAKLTEIQRQKGSYASAVAAIRDGKLEDGDTRLRALGWIVEGQGHDALVAEYARAIEEKKATGELKTVLVVDPTHKDGDALSEKLRAVRRAKKLIVGEEKAFPQLTALGWTNAQKADARQYAGTEVVQFFRNSGKFKAGQRVEAVQLLAELGKLNADAFGVFRRGELGLAVGDTVRITQNGRDVSGKHRVDNGRIDTIRALPADGSIVLGNGWVLAKDFAHLKHGLVSTSHATQSKTTDVVLAAMNKASLGAMSAEQAYVTISRGRERGMIFSDLPKEELLAAVARADGRKSATEVFGARRQAVASVALAERMRAFMDKVRGVTRQVQRRAAAVRESLKQQELGYAR